MYLLHIIIDIIIIIINTVIVVVSQGKQILNNVLVIKHKTLLHKSPENMFFFSSKNVDSISEILVVKVCDLASSLNRACASGCNVAPDSSSYRHPMDQWESSWLSASLGPARADAAIGCAEGGIKLLVWLHLYSGSRSAFTKKRLERLFSGSVCGFR